MDMAPAVPKSVDQTQRALTATYVMSRLKDAYTAAISYPFIFGFNVSTIEQKRLHMLHLPFLSSCQQIR